MNKTLELLFSKACLALLVIVFASFSGPVQAAQTIQINRVAAVVNGEMISLYDLQRQAMPEIMRQGLTGNDSYSAIKRDDIFRQTLDSMVLDILFRQEAERFQVIVNDDEVENQLRMGMEQNNITYEELERQLSAQSSSVEELKKTIRDGILRQRMASLMVARKVEITRQDVEKYYEEHIREFSTPPTVDLSMISFGPLSDAEAVRHEIESGAISFADAAKKYSTAPNAAIGGSMGDFALKDLNQTWRKAIDGLKSGEVSQLMYGNGAAMLLYVNSISEGSSQPVEEVYGAIEARLREPKIRERFDEYSAQLRSRAVVDIRI